MRKTVVTLCLVGAMWPLAAQQLVFPEREGWNVVAEGATLSFKVSGSEPGARRFSLEGSNGYAMSIDSVGFFTWTPDFDLVDRFEKRKEITLIFQAEWADGRRARQPVTFAITHTNRPPAIEELPVFYVRQSVVNRFQIPAEYITDPDNDPTSIKAIPSKLPEGASLSPAGVLTWTPSRNQFNGLKNNPITVEFLVQDQPDKAETLGKLRIAQTQQDLPPDLLLVPADTAVTIKEDDRFIIKIFASDPNGDEDLASLNFLASDPRIEKSAFVPTGVTQAEFSWSPGYSFTDDAEKKRGVELIFFAIDKETNRTEKRIRLNVVDAENLILKDQLLYQKYRATLVQAKALLDQLDENHEKLNKMYKQAKRGKKHRAIVNASFGAATGLSPFLDPEPGKIVSGLGGTTVMTLSTLEATEVIGKSKADILEKLKTNVEIRNQLQLEGDNFARKYALKSSRRAKEFEPDREKLLPILNNQKLVILELDASRPSYPKIDNKEMKKTFPDFAEEN